SCWGAGVPAVEPNEGIFRVAVRDHDKKKIERFSLAMMGFALQGPPGLGVFGGRPDVQEAYGYWPTLVPRELVRPRVETLRGDTWQPREIATVAPAGAREASPEAAAPAVSAVPGGAKRRVPLRRIAYARSGDKGDHANVGVIARSPVAYAFLRDALTADAVRGRFARSTSSSAMRSGAAARCRCGSTIKARRWGRGSSGSSSTYPWSCCRRRRTTGRAESMITREQEGGVLTLMLNRPEVGNALSPEIVTAMEEALAVATSDASV